MATDSTDAELLVPGSPVKLATRQSRQIPESNQRVDSDKAVDDDDEADSDGMPGERVELEAAPVVPRVEVRSGASTRVADDGVGSVSATAGDRTPELFELTPQESSAAFAARVNARHPSPYVRLVPRTHTLQVQPAVSSVRRSRQAGAQLASALVQRRAFKAGEAQARQQRLEALRAQAEAEALAAAKAKAAELRAAVVAYPRRWATSAHVPSTSQLQYTPRSMASTFQDSTFSQPATPQNSMLYQPATTQHSMLYQPATTQNSMLYQPATPQNSTLDQPATTSIDAIPSLALFAESALTDSVAATVSSSTYDAEVSTTTPRPLAQGVALGPSALFEDGDSGTMSTVDRQPYPPARHPKRPRATRATGATARRAQLTPRRRSRTLRLARRPAEQRVDGAMAGVHDNTAPARLLTASPRQSATTRPASDRSRAFRVEKRAAARSVVSAITEHSQLLSGSQPQLPSALGDNGNNDGVVATPYRRPLPVREMVDPHDDLRAIRSRIHSFAVRRRRLLKRQQHTEREQVGLVTSDKTEHNHDFQQWLSKHGGGSRVHMLRHKMMIMKKWFHTLDTDKSGSIGLEELEEPLLSVGLAESKADVVQLIRSVDYDGNGEVSFDEFLDLITSERPPGSYTLPHIAKQLGPKSTGRDNRNTRRATVAAPPSSPRQRASFASPRRKSSPGKLLRRNMQAATSKPASTPRRPNAYRRGKGRGNDKVAGKGRGNGKVGGKGRGNGKGKGKGTQQEAPSRPGSGRQGVDTPTRAEERIADAAFSGQGNPIVALFKSMASGALGGQGLPFQAIIDNYRRKALMAAAMARDPEERTAGERILRAIKRARSEPEREKSGGILDPREDEW